VKRRGWLEQVRVGRPKSWQKTGEKKWTEEQRTEGSLAPFDGDIMSTKSMRVTERRKSCKKVQCGHMGPQKKGAPMYPAEVTGAEVPPL